MDLYPRLKFLKFVLIYKYYKFYFILYLKIKQKCESQINDLKEKLSNCLIEKETNIKKIKIDLNNKHLELKESIQNHKDTLSKVEHLEKEVTKLQDKIKEIVKMRNELEKKLIIKNNLIEDLKIKDLQAKSKVTEAIQIVEVACYEKNAALFRENEAKRMYKLLF